MTESSGPVVLIHGDEWQWSHVAEPVRDCRAATWRREEWAPRPALRYDRRGVTTLYTGQRYDPSLARVIPDGWDHDHCEVCWWTLVRGAEPERAVGYTDGRRWLCAECHDRFIVPPADALPGPLPP